MGKLIGIILIYIIGISLAGFFWQQEYYWRYFTYKNVFPT